MSERARERVAQALGQARRRTLTLTDLDEPELVAQHDPLMSPLVWDLAHIGQQEDLWLLRGGDAARAGLLPPDVEQLYDAFRHTRADRPALPLLPPVPARQFVHDVRDQVWDRLERTRLDDAPGALFPFAMVVQHELQHDETMLAAVQSRAGPPVLGAGRALPPGGGRLVPAASMHADSVLVPGGEFVLGVDASAEPYALDNERPAHRVGLPAFRIGRVPVTNAQWREFIEDGGYHQPRWWSVRGWRHRQQAGLHAPQFWRPDGARVRFGVLEPIPDDEPVQHVCFFEAEAFAAWAGARLPSEAEWEKACAWDPVAGRRRRWPWGDADLAGDVSPGRAWRLANLSYPEVSSPEVSSSGGVGEALRPAPVGAYPQGASAYGVEQLIGDVWEWTSSPFEPWPGFTPMLYERYSQPFFGGAVRVLRGGSWAVAPTAVRPSFRNWDLPIRRQIFCGVRLAWDA
ncbi:MAG: ergothioneine biosynthesis protein EgtB [Angustibacter sp.]